MQELIRAHDNKNEPILPGGKGLLPKVYFNLLRLKAGESHTTTLPGFETVYVVQAGTCDFAVDGEPFAAVGRRKAIWDGMADSVYVPSGAKVTVTAKGGPAELAVAGGACDTRYKPFRVTPEEVDIVTVGSAEAHCRRRICHVLGHNGLGRAGNLLVSELFCDAGCWSGYPPHTHGRDQDGETRHDEVYHYRFNPSNGFGAQYCFDEGREGIVHMTKDGDTFAFSDGFHPTVTSPGHQEYVFTILVGHTQRSLVQRFHGEWSYMAKTIPGVQDMVDKFK